MLAEDRETQAALAALLQEVGQRQKRSLLWVGAGASRWCGYPGWQDFASQLHSEWSRAGASYDRVRATAALEASDFPAVFQLCSNADEQRYSRRLVETFSPRPPQPVYQRFVRTLSAFSPLHVVTTNIDELLEKSVPGAVTIGRFDLERAVELVGASSSFVAKIHGSVSDIRSIVFRTLDYQGLVSCKHPGNPVLPPLI